MVYKRFVLFADHADSSIFFSSVVPPYFKKTPRLRRILCFVMQTKISFDYIYLFPFT